MPQQLFYSNDGARSIAERVVDTWVDMKLRLFKAGFTPNIATTGAELAENEANYTGYTAGGEAVDAFVGPYLAPEGGFAIQTPTVVFDCVSTVTVPNLIGGYWLDLGSNTPAVICEFAEPQPMQVLYQSISVQVRLVFPN